MKRLRIAILALGLLAPSAMVASAQATVDSDDAAAKVVTAVRRDRAGDLHVDHRARGKVSKRVIRSIDVTRVRYRVDRVGEQLTVTYAMRHRPVPVRPYRKYFATVVGKYLLATDSTFVVLISRPGDSRVMLIDAMDDSRHRCVGGATTTRRHGRVLIQTVPFSCLNGLEHSKLWAGVGLERGRNGGDVAWDTVRRTRDLPLTAYVAPQA